MLKIGEYFRTPWGDIGKITNIPKHNKYFDDGFCLECKFITCGSEAMKELNSTPNIIDLIEPMDLMFVDIDNGYEGGIIVPRIAETQNELKKYIDNFKNNTYQLKGIITHEQIDNMEYKTGE